MKKNKINRYLKNIGKILISVILLYFVFQKIPFREVTKLWSNINFIYLLIASLLFLASQIISTKRLELFFKANNFHLSFYSNLKLYFIGMFYNFFIPGGIGGDAFKVYILNKNFGILVRNGLHCAPCAHQALGTRDRGLVRLSPGFFNTENDMDLTVKALQKITAGMSL